MRFEHYTYRIAHDTYHDYCTPITKDELRHGDPVFVTDKKTVSGMLGIAERHGHIFVADSCFAGMMYKRTINRRVYVDIICGGAFQSIDWNTFGSTEIVRIRKLLCQNQRFTD